MNVYPPSQPRAVDLVWHLGVMAAECELEAAMYEPLDWYAEFLRSLSRSYRDIQFRALEWS